MEDAKLISLHETLSKLTGRKGLGSNGVWSWQKHLDQKNVSNPKLDEARSKLPQNILYSNFLPAGTYNPNETSTNGENWGDGRYIKRDFSDIPKGNTDTEEVGNINDLKSSKKLEKKLKRKEEKKKKLKLEKMEVKRKAKLEEKKRMKKEEKLGQRARNDESNNNDNNTLPILNELSSNDPINTDKDLKSKKKKRKVEQTKEDEDDVAALPEKGNEGGITTDRKDKKLTKTKEYKNNDQEASVKKKRKHSSQENNDDGDDRECKNDKEQLKLKDSITNENIRNESEKKTKKKKNKTSCTSSKDNNNDDAFDIDRKQPAGESSEAPERISTTIVIEKATKKKNKKEKKKEKKSK